MDVTTRPIGYWLRHLHNLLEEQFSAALKGFGVDRREWQLLNLLSSGTRTRADAAAALAPFWEHPGASEPAELADLLDGPSGLVARGWVTVEPGTDGLGLTAQGRAQHGSLAARVRDTRAALLQGLGPEQYTETVRVLATMAANLERTLADRPAGGAARAESAPG